MEAREKILAIHEEAEKRSRDLANDSEGNFTPANMEAIYEDADLAIYQAGMKKVVEWLNESDWGRRKGFDWQAKLKEWGL